MHSNLVYLDHNAASLSIQEIKDKLNSLPQIPLNPSSVHMAGRKAKSLLETARTNILSSVNASLSTHNLIFTSSGTESNNTIINSFHDKIVLTSKTEHSSILAPVIALKNHFLIKVDTNGYIDFEQLDEFLETYENQCFISIHFVNNETGVMQDIKKICQLAHARGAIVHSDAIQAYGKIPLDLINLDLDLITISSNKVGGPKGVSAIISKRNIPISSMLKGGSQERGKRAGSENIEAIIGFGEFALHANESINKFENISKISKYIENEVLKISANAVVGEKSKRIGNTSCLIMPGKSSELQQIAFDLKDIAISTGSACSSGKITRSHVLEAMGIDDKNINCAIRVSLGYNNTYEEAKIFINAWKEIFLEQNNNIGER